MYKKKIKYVDYNGVEREEEFLFNLNESEVFTLELSYAGTYTEAIKAIIDAQDQAALIKMFRELILKAYGEKSADGKHFMKSEEISKKFECTEAFNKLFMELATDDKAGAEFVNGVMPQKAGNENSVTEVAIV